MSYSWDPFIANHPVFRREELMRAIEMAVPKTNSGIEQAASGILTRLVAAGQIVKIRSGLYASSAVLKASPVWLPYAVASRWTKRSVLGMQGALWFHLGYLAPNRLHVYCDSRDGEAEFQGRSIVPLRSIRKATLANGSIKPEFIHSCLGRFEGCPVEIRATTLESTIVDILDGMIRRPKETGDVAPPIEDPDESLFKAGVPGSQPSWPPDDFRECWTVLSKEALTLDFDEIRTYLLEFLKCKTTTAKVGYFLWINRARFGLREEYFASLIDLPQTMHSWAEGVHGEPVRRWNLYVPTCLIPQGLAEQIPGHPQTEPRLRPEAIISGSSLREALESRFGRFGIRHFRGCQEAVVRAVLEGQDTLAILPTGAGKSLTYQFPATLFNGPTLVVSPLISLTADQVREARSMDLIAYSLGGPNQAEILGEVALALDIGTLNLLFVSPETWPMAVKHWPALRHRTALIVIDEAHLMGSWGNDFRPEYLTLGKLREVFNMTPILALTATATSTVRENISRLLRFREGYVVQKLPVKRPRLYLRREKTGNRFEDKFKALLAFLVPRREIPGIVYCTSKKEAEKVAHRLRNDLFVADLDGRGFPERANATRAHPRQGNVRIYHADLSRDDRAAAQEAFRLGDCSLMVATIAFGMGLNKRDIRFVVHFSPPSSIDEYVQEVGRAGRDGLWADCLLLYSSSDWRRWAYRYAGQGVKRKAKRPGIDGVAPHQQLDRIMVRRNELAAMQSFVEGTQCLHARIERHFEDLDFGPADMTNCKISCECCCPVVAHEQMVNDGFDRLGPCGAPRGEDGLGPHDSDPGDLELSDKELLELLMDYGKDDADEFLVTPSRNHAHGEFDSVSSLLLP